MALDLSQQRVWFIGCSGSGKSTWASRVSERGELSYNELDALYHLPNWTTPSPEDFHRVVTAVASGATWVIDGNYSDVRDVMFRRATVIVALDVPRLVVLRQVLARTIGRLLTRRVLWNGNREPLTGLLRWNPERSVVRWSWTTWPELHRRIRWIEQVAERQGITMIVGRSHRDVERKLEAAFGMDF